MNEFNILKNEKENFSKELNAKDFDKGDKKNKKSIYESLEIKDDKWTPFLKILYDK